MREDNGMEENETKIKTTPKISLKTSKLKSSDTLTILLKNTANSPLKNKKVNLLIDGRNLTLKTNQNGEASVSLTLLPKKYKITIEFQETRIQTQLPKNSLSKFQKCPQK